MRSLTPPPYPIALTETLAPVRRNRWTLRAMGVVLTGLALMLALAGGARAASVFYIRGGGDGHGIGMSQYGAYGYALHGADYRAILAHYYEGTEIGSTDPQRIVRVLLATGHASFTAATTANGKHLNAGATYEVTAQADGRLVLRTSAGKKLATFTAPLSVSGPGPVQVPGQGSYRGSLQFSPDGNGGVQTVNAVGLDDYVRGVVAAEMPASWAPAALEAQAVAARTYAITTSVDANGYDLYDDTRSQVYGGVGAETAATNAAVAATSGQIVTYDGQPAVTYFFSSSGGHTESIQNAWPGSAPEPWLRGVPDPYDNVAGNPNYRWGSQMTLAAAAAKLGGLVRGSLIGIEVTRHGVSPRIVQARVVGTGGSTTVSGAQLQSIFGLSSTYVAFTAITAQDPSGELSGTIYPAPASGSATVQSDAGGSWHTLTTTTVSPVGGYSLPLPAGRYRIVVGSLDGPAVAVS